MKYHLLILITVFLGLSVILAACQSRRIQPEYGPQPEQPLNMETVGSEAVEVPDEGKPADVFSEYMTADGKFDPDPNVRPLVLVLGPAFARGFAHAGVIRALRDEKIPLGAVIGVGEGALIGALYATSNTVNEFEWKLMKFEKDVFIGSSFSLTKIFGGNKSGNKLVGVLDEVFGKTTMKQVDRFILRIAIHSESIGGFSLESRGRISPLLRVALSEPELFDPNMWLGASAWSASSVKPYPVKEARALDIGPVAVVDLIRENEYSEVVSVMESRIGKRLADARIGSREELESADIIIRPDLNGIGYLDYDKKTAAVFRGKVEVRKHLDEIRKLVGLSEGLQVSRFSAF